MNERIAPHTKIRGSYIGRLGFLGYDRDRGRPVAVTARQILKNKLFLRRSRQLLGKASVIDFEKQGNEHGTNIAELLALAELRGDVLFEQSKVDESFPTGLEVRGIHSEPEELLGSRLWLKLGADNYREVFVETVGGRFLMPHPKSEEATLFNGAIGVASIDGQKLTVHGDAGTLAVSEDGQAVGVVVCGRGSKAFIAPLAHFLKQFGDIVALTNQHIEMFQRPRKKDVQSTPTKRVLSQTSLNKKLEVMNRALQGDDDEALRAIASEIEDEVLT